MPNYKIVILLMCVSHAINAQSTPEGQKVYESNCVRCHGRKGNRGFLGAKNLQKTELNPQQIVEKITNGKGLMPSWRNSLSKEDILRVSEYVRSLKSSNHKSDTL